MSDDDSIYEAERNGALALAEQHLRTALDLLTAVMPAPIALSIATQICEDHLVEHGPGHQSLAPSARH